MGTDILRTDRRSFLRDLPLGGAVLLLALQIQPVRLAARPVRSVQLGKAAMISVGRAYLDQAPDEANAERLRQFLNLAAEVSALYLAQPGEGKIGGAAVRGFPDRPDRSGPRLGTITHRGEALRACRTSG